MLVDVIFNLFLFFVNGTSLQVPLTPFVWGIEDRQKSNFPSKICPTKTYNVKNGYQLLVIFIKKWGLKPCTFQQRNDLQGLHPSFNAQLLAMFFGVISSGHRCLFASPRKTCGQVDSDSFHNGAKSSAT